MTEKRNIPFSPPDITEQDINEVIDVLRSGWITTGPKTDMFEKELTEYCRTSRAVTFSSATSAMEMTLRLLGVGPGDEVITSAYTYTSSASIIHHVGATIVLIDTGKDSYHLYYEAIADAITEHTKVIIPVDIAGSMCDYDRIFEIIETKRHLFKPANKLQAAFGRVIVLADAAHSLGATYKGRMSGEVADFTAFSFHAVKNLTTAEGGATVWREIPGFSSDEIYQEFRLRSLHGQSKDALAKSAAGSWEYDIIAPYYKCNMTDIMASLGLSQLKRYDMILARRKAMVQKYDAGLFDLGVKSLEHFTQQGTSSGHLYMLQLVGKNEEFRNQLIRSLAETGIACNVHFKPLPMLTAYKDLGFDIKDFPNALAMYQTEITLPLYTRLRDEDVEYIIHQMKLNY